MSGQSVQSPITPVIELCLLLEIIERIADEGGECQPGFPAAAVSYLANRARVIAGDMHEVVDCSALRPAQRRSREVQDDVSRFAGDRIVNEPHAVSKAADIWTAYLKWCEDNEEGPVTQTMLGRRLRQMGYEKKESNGVVRYLGVALSAAAE